MKFCVRAVGLPCFDIRRMSGDSSDRNQDFGKYNEHAKRRNARVAVGEGQMGKDEWKAGESGERRLELK